jgi:hypothetical protein
MLSVRKPAPIAMPTVAPRIVHTEPRLVCHRKSAPPLCLIVDADLLLVLFLDVIKQGAFTRRPSPPPQSRTEVAELRPANARHVVAPLGKLDHAPAAGALLPLLVRSQIEQLHVLDGALVKGQVLEERAEEQGNIRDLLRREKGPVHESLCEDDLK